MRKWVMLAICVAGTLRVAAQVTNIHVNASNVPTSPIPSSRLPGGSTAAWAIAGVGGIPARVTTCATIAAATCSNGASDCTSTIQSALTACTAEQTVVLGAGTFKIASSLSVPAKVTLRGAGADQTILSCTGTSAQCIALGSVIPSTANVTNITSGATRGSTSLVVASATGITTSSYLIITELNDATYVTSQGDNPNCTWCDDSFWSGTRVRGQIVEVTSVSGTTLGISPALYSDYGVASGTSPATANRFTPVLRAGLEALQVLSNNSGYTSGGYNGMIHLSGCGYCWVKGIEVNYQDNNNWVVVNWGLHDEIRDSYFSNDYSRSSGVDGSIFIASKTSATLLENNIMERTHASIMLNWGAAGNVIAYNYMVGDFDPVATNFVIGGVSMHGAHPQFNLLEGNVANQVYVDNLWGTNSHNTTFRNWWEGTTKTCAPTANGRVTVTCSSSWFPYQASRAIEVGSLSTTYNFVADVAGSTNQNTMTGNLGAAMSKVAVLRWPSTRDYDGVVYNMTFGYGQSSDTGTGSLDATTPYSTAFIYDVYTYASAAKQCASNGSASTCGATLPASFYLSSRPSWFRSVVYPPIGSDVTGGLSAGAGHVHTIPAQDCYQTVMGGADGGAGSPFTFNAVACYGS